RGCVGDPGTRSVRIDEPAKRARESYDNCLSPASRVVSRCFRSVLLLTHSHLLASKATYVGLTQIRVAEGKFVCNILLHKNSGRPQQHLMTEAPRQPSRRP